jgi:hypothetical protein
MLTLFSLLLAPAVAQDIDFGASGSASTGDDAYVIQPGDTLWDISTTFMGDPYYWPRLWSINDYITNPHWIYPGERIVFTPGSLLDAPEMMFPQDDDGYAPDVPSLSDSELECGPDVRFQGDFSQAFYSTAAFLSDEGDIEDWGELQHAKSGQSTLGSDQIVYLNLDDPDAVACGDIVSIFRLGEKVRHPSDRAVKYGNLVLIVGDARVLHVDPEGRVTAVMRRSFRHAKRGDRVGPPMVVDAQVAGLEPNGDLEGTIIAREDSALNELAQPGEVVFIDRGKADGVRVGNSFYVIHQRDGYVSWSEDLDAVPEQVVARLVITRVDEGHAAGILVDMDHKVSVGDHVGQTVQ